MKKDVLLAFGTVSLGRPSLTACLIGCDGYASSYRLQPTPRNETSFYRSYNPESILKIYRDERWGYGGGDGDGSSNGFKSILHTRDFTPDFAMQANRERELLNALCDDVLRQLKENGMTVVAASYNVPDAGLTYKYQSGESVGKISIHPPVHNAYIHRNMALPSGLEDVRLEIDIEETWTRPAGEARWWMSLAG